MFPPSEVCSVVYTFSILQSFANLFFIKKVFQNFCSGRLLIYFAFLLSVLLRPHHHNFVMVVFFVFLFVFEPSKTFMTSLGDGCLILLEKDKRFAHEMIFYFYSERDFEFIVFSAG